jgi:hypothetical protein
MQYKTLQLALGMAFSGLFVMTSVAQTNTPLQSSAVFADSLMSAQLLQKQDDFTESWSAFDIQARLNNSGADKFMLLKYCAEQARNWTAQELDQLQLALEFLDQRITKLNWKLPLPEKIQFVKTTGLEEGGAAGYTRSNFIVLKAFDDLPNLENLSALIAHELFHIISRHNPEVRKDLYALIGFKTMAPIAYPRSLQHLRITNPDATQTDCYITLLHEGDKVDCMMLLYASDVFSGGSFFQYLKIGFAKLTPDHQIAMDLTTNAPIIYEHKELMGFFEQVGRNTRYTIHPEEILADNFLMALMQSENVPSPHILEAITKKFKQQ